MMGEAYWTAASITEVDRLRAELARLRAALAEREVETRRLKQDLAESQRGHADTIRLTVSFKQQLDAARAELAAKEDECRRWSAAFEEARVRQNQTTAELAAEGARLVRFHDEMRRERQVWRAEVVDAKAELAAVAGERERYRAALLQVRVWTSTPKGLTDRKAQLAAIKHIADDALAPPPPVGEA